MLNRGPTMQDKKSTYKAFTSDLLAAQDVEIHWCTCTAHSWTVWGWVVCQPSLLKNGVLPSARLHLGSSLLSTEGFIGRYLQHHYSGGLLHNIGYMTIANIQLEFSYSQDIPPFWGARENQFTVILPPLEGEELRNKSPKICSCSRCTTSLFCKYQWIMIPLQTCMTSGEADWELQAKKVDRSVPLNWMQDLWLISVNTENHSWILFESLNRTDSCLSFYICSLQSCFKYHNWFKINNIYICCSKNLRVSYMLTGKYYQCDIFTSHGNPLMWIYPLLGLQGQNKSIIHVFKNS